jgi:hypothetical protein
MNRSPLWSRRFERSEPFDSTSIRQRRKRLLSLTGRTIETGNWGVSFNCGLNDSAYSTQRLLCAAHSPVDTGDLVEDSCVANNGLAQESKEAPPASGKSAAPLAAFRRERRVTDDLVSLISEELKRTTPLSAPQSYPPSSHLLLMAFER